jgi:hypothetical protein
VLAGRNATCSVVLTDVTSTMWLMVTGATSAFSGNFTIRATSDATCGLGVGVHDLADGATVATGLATGTGTKCYFRITPKANADLLDIVQQASTVNSAFNLTAKHNGIPTTQSWDCADIAYWLVVQGLNLTKPASCSQLLDDNLPWTFAVRRTLAQGPQFNVTATSTIIPTLENGNLTNGHADAGGAQYWKVVLPENATRLSVLTQGDPTLDACSAVASVVSAGSIACLAAEIPTFLACTVVSQQNAGLTCADLDRTLADRCARAGVDAATCATLEGTRLAACAAANQLDPGACDPAAIDGSLAGACRIVNTVQPATCSGVPSVQNKPEDVDLYVRYGGGLPTTSTSTCASAHPGTIEQCTFQTDLANLQNQTDPVLANVPALLATLTQTINDNRGPLDQAVSDAQGALGNPVNPPKTLPATPSLGFPTVPHAQPLPGHGRYFIMVKGPNSAILTQGGDYHILASWDTGRLLPG